MSHIVLLNISILANYTLHYYTIIQCQLHAISGGGGGGGGTVSPDTCQAPHYFIVCTNTYRVSPMHDQRARDYKLDWGFTYSGHMIVLLRSQQTTVKGMVNTYVYV